MVHFFSSISSLLLIQSSFVLPSCAFIPQSISMPRSSTSASTTFMLLNRNRNRSNQIETKTRATNNDDSAATTTATIESPNPASIPIPTEWKGEILQSLSSIIDPDFNRDIVTLGFIQNIQLNDDTRQISFDVELTTPACPIKEEFQTLCENAVNGIAWTNGRVAVTMTSQPPLDDDTNTPQMGGNLGASDVPFGLSKVKSIIAVSSCKGGVGKSTTAVNLAYALSDLGASVGIFDADVYGPSLPTMVTPDDDAVMFVGRQISPLARNGVKLMSFGYVNDGSAVMRGPMVTQLLDQFLSLTYWGPLDYLILDMPPGTGDIQLTLSQRLNITAAVIVTTPQELSFVDVERGIEMFDTVNVPCISVVENMAYLEIDEDDTNDTSNSNGMTLDEDLMRGAFTEVLKEHGLEINGSEGNDKVTNDLLRIVQQTMQDMETQKRKDKKQLKIFGRGHKDRLSSQWGIEHTYSVPLMEKIAANGDNGTPFILEYPKSEQASIYKDLASSVVREVAKIQFSEKNNRPSVNYDESKNVIKFSFGDEQQQRQDDSEEEGSEIDLNTMPSAELRRECKCAACVEELTGRQILQPEDIPDSVRPLKMSPTGNYALSVDWSDGHKSLYPYKQIRALLEEQGAQLEKKEEVIA